MISFIQNISSSGQFLETEHGLVMVLLLYGLLTYQGPKLRGWIPVALISGILISIFTPAYEIDLFWPVITGLVVPPFLWQAAVAVTKSGPVRRQWSLLVWVITLLLVIFSLFQFGQIPLSTALLLGILSVTLVWYFRELDIERSYLSTVGLIALVVLLVEIDLAVLSINFWIGTLASGTAIGIGVGFLGIYLFRRLKRLKRELKWKNAFFFALAYFAYLAGIIFQTSAITTTLATGLVVSVFGYSTGLWYRQKDIPVTSNIPIFFYLAAGLWLALGWQAHVAIDPTSLMGIIPALAVIAAGILVAWRIAPISSENRLSRLLRKEAGVLLLLLGSILFWPRAAFLTTISVEIALVASIFLIILLRVALKPFFDLIGVQLSWPSNNN